MVNDPKFLLTNLCNLDPANFTVHEDKSVTIKVKFKITQDICKNGKLLINFKETYNDFTCNFLTFCLTTLERLSTKSNQIILLYRHNNN